jgi:hypothetical protein
MFEFEVCNKMLFGANCEQMRVNELCHRFIVLVGESRALATPATPTTPETVTVDSSGALRSCPWARPVK